MTTVFLVNDNAELAKALDMVKSDNVNCLALGSHPTGSPNAVMEVAINEPQMSQKQPSSAPLSTRAADSSRNLTDVDQSATNNLSAVQQDALRQVMQTLHQASLEQNTPLESNASPFGPGGWKPVKP